VDTTTNERRFTLICLLLSRKKRHISTASRLCQRESPNTTIHSTLDTIEAAHQQGGVRSFSKQATLGYPNGHSLVFSSIAIPLPLAMKAAESRNDDRSTLHILLAARLHDRASASARQTNVLRIVKRSHGHRHGWMK
jgi:hypothetical protein